MDCMIRERTEINRFRCLCIARCKQLQVEAPKPGTRTDNNQQDLRTSKVVNTDNQQFSDSVMDMKLVVVLVTLLGGCVAASSTPQAEQKVGGRERRIYIPPSVLLPNITINPKLLQLAKLYILTRECEVSLPQKSSLVCRAKRLLELKKMKEKWNLYETSYGFALLKTSNLTSFIFTTLLAPFTRFYLEGYLQTVLVSDGTRIVYNNLVNKVTNKEIGHMYNYKILSQFFEMSAKLGGEYATRPSQYEAFIDTKTDWISDKYFTQQRLAGVNPMSLKRVTIDSSEEIGLEWLKLKEKLNLKFDWQNAVQKALGTNDTLDVAILQGRIYALRYELCDDLPTQPDLTDSAPNRKMWNTLSPIALFASTSDLATNRSHLVPVAIQMDYKPDSPVYTPDDGDNWMMAKLNVQVTDLGYGQIVEHLAKVHFLMEPFCVILKRTLSSQHPLHEILQYHCRDVTVPNTIGTPALVNEGAYMDQLFAFGNNGTERLLADAYPLSTWDVTDFRTQLKKRGVDDKELLPYFPYRDDGEEILVVIENMVKEYVNLYYFGNDDVKNDKEFKRFLNELSLDGSRLFNGRIGRIQGLPAKVETKEELCDIVTRIISQLTIQHAAVNYPLSDYAEFTPNLPTKLYNDTSLEEGEFSVLRLPNRNTSAIEASFSNSLALYRYDTLFDYGNELRDNNAVRLLNNYHAYLMNTVQPRMQNTNEERKENGDLTYPYLIPRWIPNGIQT